MTQVFLEIFLLMGQVIVGNKKIIIKNIEAT